MKAFLEKFKKGYAMHDGKITKIDIIDSIVRCGCFFIMISCLIYFGIIFSQLPDTIGLQFDLGGNLCGKGAKILGVYPYLFGFLISIICEVFRRIVNKSTVKEGVTEEDKEKIKDIIHLIFDAEEVIWSAYFVYIAFAIINQMSINSNVLLILLWLQCVCIIVATVFAWKVRKKGKNVEE